MSRITLPRGIDAPGTKSAIDKLRCERSLHQFIRRAWHIVEPGQPFVDNWHIEAICAHLEAITRGETLENGRPYNRLLINVPPGMMKSLIVNVFWPAWEWGPMNMPHMRFICAAHQQTLAIRDSTKMRRLVTSDWYQRYWGDHVVLTGDQNAKCLLRDTQITMADGSLRAVQDVKPGEYVLSYDLKQNGIVADKVVHVWSNGSKPARKITLSDGTKITATHNHRLFGWDKFVFTPDMNVGDPIAVIERTPSQSGDLSVDDSFLLALWLAEGAKSNTSYMFSNIDPLIIARVQEISDRRGWVMKKYGDCSYTVVCGSQTGDSPMNVLKKYVGGENTYGERSKLNKQSIDRIRVPAAVFAARDDVVSEFLGTYFATDGCVTNGKNHALDIVSVSEHMVRDLVQLLKRFGVAANIHSQRTQYVYKGELKEGRTAWRVIIRTSSEILKLANLFIYGKNKKFAGLLEWCATLKRHEGSRSANIPPHAGVCRWSSKKTAVNRAQSVGDDQLVARLTNGLSWRKIVNIEEIDNCETWHMETESTHLFFAEGVLSHNTKFENTATGFREAIAAGSITGSRGDRVLIDDPHSVEGAGSDAMRATTLEWFAEALPTRLNNPASSAIVVIMQRLHEEDVSGVILERKGFAGTYDHLCLPMRYETWRAGQATWLGYKDPREEDGELLFPERFPADVVDDLEGKLGPYATAGQLQQAPTPRGGGVVKDSWWQLWEGDAFPSMDYVVASLDTAYSTKADERGDYSALTIWGVWSGNPHMRTTRDVDRYGRPMERPTTGAISSDLDAVPRVMLMYAWAERLDLHDLVTKTIKDCTAMKVDKILIENKAAGHSVAQEIRRLMSHEKFFVQMYDPKSIDKLGRLYSVQHLFAEGMIHAPDRKFAEEVIRQVSTFPRGKHDDLVDTVSMALRHLRDIGLLTRSVERMAEIDESKQFHGSAPPPLYAS